MFFPLSQSACHVRHVHVHCRNVFLRSLSPGNVHHESQSSRAVGVTQNSTSHQLVLQSCRRGRNITISRGSGFSNCGQKPNRYHSRTSKQDKTRWTEIPIIPTVWYTQSPYQFWRLGGVCLQNKRWHTSDELHLWILVAFPQQSIISWVFLDVFGSTYQIHKYKDSPKT